MLSPRFLILGVSSAAIALLAGAGPTQEAMKPARWAPRMEAPFKPSGPIAPLVDLRPEIKKLGLAVRDQGDRGTCSVFATTFLIEYHDARAKGKKDLDLSEEYLNWAKNRANKTDVDGGMFVDIIAGFKEFGMVPIKDMPYMASFDAKHPDTPRESVIDMGKKFPKFPFTFIKNWDNQKGMSEKQLDATKAALNAGIPVATGIWWLEKFETV